MTEPQLAASVGAGVSARVPTERGSSAKPWPGWLRRVQPGSMLRRHWLVSILLAAGLTLRVLSTLAYHPALLYIDTVKYLYGVYPGADPLGYRAAPRAPRRAAGVSAPPPRRASSSSSRSSWPATCSSWAGRASPPPGRGSRGRPPGRARCPAADLPPGGRQARRCARELTAGGMGPGAAPADPQLSVNASPRPITRRPDAH